MNMEKRWINSKALFQMIEAELDERRKVSFTVTGMSMWPFLCHGRDQVILEKVQREDLKLGDIVLFCSPEDNYTLHRITSLGSDTFQTTGDSNCYRDPSCSYDKMIGRVCEVVRKKQTIECNNCIWICFSRAWMLLFPIRHSLITCWMKIRKFVK